MPDLTHLSDTGEARMVDVSTKAVTERVAVAEGRVVMQPAALARVLAAPRGPLRRESVGLSQAYGRTLATDLAAKRTQPPKAISAMDGYALRAQDTGAAGARLTLIGTSAAGRGFAGKLGSG